ncbi:MAG: aldehyde dehydrogenase family protein [Acetobacter papayae]|uniref:aldehyde dehydrogenase family protein n=1 Tax=Acetobacter papayae TaxID=1076592 RepID=UPI0039E9BDEE
MSTIKNAGSVLDMEYASSPQYSDSLKAFLQRRHGLYIGGQWCEAEGTERIAVIDPATGKAISSIAAGNGQDIDRAVNAARSTFKQGAWADMTPLERSKLLFRFAAVLEEHADELAEMEAVDAGKPVVYARHADMALSCNIYHYMAGWATKLNGEAIKLAGSAGGHAYSLREPVGVAGLIVPWNFPMVLLAYKLAPALAAGCTVVIKPAENTSLTTLRLAELAELAGIPAGVINVVTGFGAEAGGALVRHPDVDKVAFTGSTDVGRQIAIMAAQSNLKRVTLELGGKSPVLVMPDADVEKTVAGVMRGIFFNQGQVCTAGSRLYLPRSLHDTVVAELSAAIDNLVCGHGLDTAVTMGPLISQVQKERVLGYINAAESAGATIVQGKIPAEKGGFFVPATLIVNATSSMSCVTEEIFGPVLSIILYEDEEIEKLVSDANDTVFGLAASIWTQNFERAHKLAARVEAGTVWINTHNYFDPTLPFGGMKQSGWGREGGFEAIRMFTEIKAVCSGY